MNKLPISLGVRHNAPIILDGAMGTLRLNSDTEFSAVEAHLAYLQAGAQIITTDTVALAARAANEGNLCQVVEECRVKALAAIEAATIFRTKHPDKPIWVAGSIGPIGCHCMLSKAEKSEIYCRLVAELATADVDVALIETAISPDDVRTAIEATHYVAPQMPVILSVTLTGQSSPTLLKQFAHTASDTNVIAAGLNCVGVDALSFRWLQSLRQYTNLPAIFYPSIDSSVTPSQFVAMLRPLLQDHAPAIIGGCCGTTPAHIRALICEIQN